MNINLQLLAAVVGIKPGSRAMRSFWVPNKNPLSMRKHSLRYGRFNFRFAQRRHVKCMATRDALCRNARERHIRRGEEYRMRRRPFAGWAV